MARAVATREDKPSVGFLHARRASMEMGLRCRAGTTICTRQKERVNNHADALLAAGDGVTP